jgi:isoleucyl-tRNA synthetase
MLAPILAFTADEAWEFVPGKNVNSVHESEFKPTNFVLPEEEKSAWDYWFFWRERALEKLEIVRQKKEIGKSLDAKIVWLLGEGDKLALAAQKNPENLRELFNVSQLEIKTSPAQKIAGPDNLISHAVDISIFRADGQKCERCWHWETDIGKNPEHPTICGRCVEAVLQLKI